MAYFFRFVYLTSMNLVNSFSPSIWTYWLSEQLAVPALRRWNRHDRRHPLCHGDHRLRSSLYESSNVNRAVNRQNPYFLTDSSYPAPPRMRSTVCDRAECDRANTSGNTPPDSGLYRIVSYRARLYSPDNPLNRAENGPYRLVPRTRLDLPRSHTTHLPNIHHMFKESSASWSQGARGLRSIKSR
jgi:hypothetical protein